MNKKTLIIIGLLITLFISLVIIKEIDVRPKLSLIKDVEEIVENIEKYNYKGDVLEIVIDNEYKLDNKTYSVSGKGIIFLEEDYSIMLSRDGMCAIKMPYLEEVMFQDEECPDYRLVDGEKIVLK